MEPNTTPPSPERPLSAHIGFHFAGSFVTGGAVVAGVIAVIFANFSIGHCGESGANLLRQYRLALACIGLAVTAVPAAWAFLAYRMKMAWQPWVLIAVAIALYVTTAIVKTNHYEGFCLF